MAAPSVQVLACSNVYIRSMHFKTKGDVEIGHCHTYDHATLLSSGAVEYEVLDGFDGTAVLKREFRAPAVIYVVKDKYHRLTAMENNTVCACIHALKTIDEEIIPPDSLIDAVTRGYHGQIRELVIEKTGKDWAPLVHHRE